MSLLEELQAIRHGVAFARMEHVVVLRVRGDDAFDLLDAVCPRSPSLHDGQALHTVLLRSDGTIFADLYVLADDTDYVLFAEGPTATAAIEYLAMHAPVGNRARVEDLCQTHVVYELLGPYAWELLGEIVGPELHGITYLNAFGVPELQGICLRAGKIGEYAYDLVIPRERRSELEARLDELGPAYSLRAASLEALDLCALENAFHCIRTPGLAELTPVELQLQWRLSSRRAYPGAEAVETRRRAGAPRIAWFTGRRGERALPPVGAALRCEGMVLGSVRHAAFSPMLDTCLGLALLERRWSHSGIERLEVDGTDGLVVRTTSPPVLHNRSLFVDLHRHAYRSRDRDVFPPVVPEERMR